MLKNPSIRDRGLRLGYRLRDLLRPALKGASVYVPHFEGKIGLEIGGPSGLFRDPKFLPLYWRVARVDGVNFSTNTVWHSHQHEGQSYDYLPGRDTGFQYILDGTDLQPHSFGGL